MIVAVPKILRERLTDEGAEALVKIIDQAEEQTQKVVMEMAEGRFEKRVAQVESNLRVEIAQVESKLESKISEVRVEVSRTRADLIRWMFIFWAGQVGVLTSILFAFFKPH